jgi:hypothetical protein
MYGQKAYYDDYRYYTTEEIRSRNLIPAIRLADGSLENRTREPIMYNADDIESLFGRIDYDSPGIQEFSLSWRTGDPLAIGAYSGINIFLGGTTGVVTEGWYVSRGTMVQDRIVFQPYFDPECCESIRSLLVFMYIKESAAAVSDKYPSNYFDATILFDGSVRFNIGSSQSPAELQIFDLNGRLLKKFTSSSENSSITWDGSSTNGSIVPAGIYIAHLRDTSNRVNSIKFPLIK